MKSATAAVAVSAWPAIPSLTPSSVAIGVGRPAGRNSAVTRPNTPSAIATTAPPQAGASPAGTPFVHRKEPLIDETLSPGKLFATQQK